MSEGVFLSIKFEVHGRVQGVFFRKYTKAKADELGLTGWCRNTPSGTVDGEFEYTPDDRNNNASEFRYWLANIGSPNSRIDACTFSDEASSPVQRFVLFKVIR